MHKLFKFTNLKVMELLLWLKGMIPKTNLHLPIVGKCHCIVVTSEYRQITAFYKIVRVYRHIYFTATFISYPHPSLHVNKRVGKATLIMSYQEIFNVKYREYREEGSLWGRKNHTEDNVWRKKILVLRLSLFIYF